MVKAKASPEEVKLWLEWAGAKLLSLQISSPKPKPPGSAWPEYARDARSAYGYSGERLRPATPRAKEIELMDEILIFPSLIRDDNSRKIVNARALVTPLSNRYLYSWPKLAFMLHTSRHHVIRLHYLGLLEITSRAAPEKVDAVRHHLSSPSLIS